MEKFGVIRPDLTPVVNDDTVHTGAITRDMMLEAGKLMTNGPVQAQIEALDTDLVKRASDAVSQQLTERK